MAKVHPVTLKLQTEGFAGIKGIGQDFKKFTSTVAASKPQLDRFIKGITAVHGNTKLSKVAFEGQISALKRLRDNVGIGTKAYSRLGVEIDKVRTKMNAATAAAIPQGGMFQRLNARFNKIPVGGRAALGALAGTATAGLGTTGQLAFAGGAVGGVAGAAIGAGIGATVDTVKAAAASAKYAAQIGRLEIALKGVTKTSGEFAKAQGIIASVSNQLNVPIGASTKQFTTLSASVIGAGGNVDDAEKVFRGVSEAIKATGGDAEDVQSAIRAMSQIFGKGKVSAEELQGQLGERLPGAVVKFAEATGRTLPELQKDLRDGTVGLNDVMKFVTKLSTDHAEAAKLMADSGMDAGQRLTVAMQRLQLHLGRIMQPIGAFFQKTMAIIINSINRAIEALGRFFNVGTQNQRKNLAAEVTSASQAYTLAIREGLDKSTDPRDKARFNRIKNRRDAAFANQKAFFDENPSAAATSKFDDPTSEIDKEIRLAKIKQELGLIGEQEVKNLEIQKKAAEYYKEIGGDANKLGLTIESITEKLKNAKVETKSFKESFKELYDSVTDLNTNLSQYAVGAIDRLADSFVDLMVTGKATFGELARSILQDIQRMILKAILFQTIFSPLKNFLGLADGGVVSEGATGEVTMASFNAKGNVFAKNKIVPYAYGGIVNKPTLFPMANGMGLMGEAGAEAIMPLRRHSNGKLGVEASGGMGNVVVNVDASGTAAQGDNSRSKEFGRLIGVAIEAEIVKQKRPGGLLYN